jgi:conjugative relaxase-like TrwC/TraI family protein
MHGGLKIYRGSAAAARNYVEADRARADDYYLAEGSGYAELCRATRNGSDAAIAVHRVRAMDGDTYERWVGGVDIATGAPKGRLRTDDQAVRFGEIAVNGPKTWSLVAALHPEIATAYDAAQQRAAEEIAGWVAAHATTRIGPRGRQVQVAVDQIEATIVRHYTSRAGDPHRHLHLQINARVLVDGEWRGLHTIGIRDCLGAINGIGHAAIMCNPEFRGVLAAHGYTLDPDTGEVNELKPFRRTVLGPNQTDPREHRPLRGRMAHRPSGPATRAETEGHLGPSRLEGRPAGQSQSPRRGGTHPSLVRRTTEHGVPAYRSVVESARYSHRAVRRACGCRHGRLATGGD